MKPGRKTKKYRQNVLGAISPGNPCWRERESHKVLTTNPQTPRIECFKISQRASLISQMFPLIFSPTFSVSSVEANPKGNYVFWQFETAKHKRPAKAIKRAYSLIYVCPKIYK